MTEIYACAQPASLSGYLCMLAADVYMMSRLLTTHHQLHSLYSTYAWITYIYIHWSVFSRHTYAVTLLMSPQARQQAAGACML